MDVITVRQRGGKVHLAYKGSASSLCGLRRSWAVSHSAPSCQHCIDRSGRYQQQQARRDQIDSTVARLERERPARTKLEEVRTEMLQQLERIAAEVRMYGKLSDTIDYGHVGSLTEALKALDEMHGFGRAYKIEAAKR